MENFNEKRLICSYPLNRIFVKRFSLKKHVSFPSQFSAITLEIKPNGETKMQKQIMDKDWLNKRNEQIKKEREENSRYITLQNGENVVEIDLTEMPVEVKGMYGTKFVYTTTTKKTINNKEISLLLSASKILDGLIIKALSEGFNPFTLIKVGEGKNTRYAIKEFDN